MKPTTIKIITVGCVIYILMALLTSCYTRSKAQKSFARATVTYPEIAADYCSRTYPPRDSLIHGRDIIHVDTLWGEGETIVKNDTLRTRDTIYIRTTRELPGRVIERTLVRTDTIRVTNTAEVDKWVITARDAVSVSVDKTKEASYWRKIAKKRFWIILGLGAAIAIGVVAMIRKKVVGKLPI